MGPEMWNTVCGGILMVSLEHAQSMLRSGFLAEAVLTKASKEEIKSETWGPNLTALVAFPLVPVLLQSPK